MSRHRKRSAMEGVGARLGRSSTRYGPATVFTGPVRKWKKKWVHVSPSSASSNSNTNHNHNHNHTHNHTHTHSHASNASHLLLYKWTPITQSHNTTTNSNANGTAKDALPEPPEEPPRRKFKYVPVALLEEQRNEAAENEGAEKVDDDSKPIDSDSGAADPARKNETLDEKPDINDVPMEESQVVRQDLNESTLDLSLGLTSHDDEHDSDSKTNQARDGQ
ncbi:probable serine/threonine-protein kinase DDB_G0282963 isoform X2 [Cajanus cajan]|uniref:probable serine/threonine-protein kinase DDB_G0282963 isoform X2 n=1 Tax=Cajanus cajan TaxID=3821 RepID=UPI0010FB0169|nr:probable serine/threonine-protein kinase DDB_G0282963 isoform X2 [Cajanus cajan]